MPTYQYACTRPEGKHEFEVVQSFTDPALTECPECGAAVRKVYGSVGVVFKGSGFYRTDSRKTAATSESSSSSSSSSDSSSGGSSSNGSSSGGSSSGTTPAPSSSGSAGTPSTGKGSGSKAAD